MSITSSRRSLLMGAVVVPALTISAAAPASAVNDDAQIESLWIERTRIVAETHVIARAVRQLPEEDAVGIEALEKKSDDLVVRLCKIDDIIGHAAPSPTKSAAMFMIRLVSGFVNESLNERTDIGLIAGGLLPTLRPQLTGLIAHHIDDLIRHPSKTHREREFCEA